MKYIILDYNSGDYINTFDGDLPDYGNRIKKTADPEVGLRIYWISSWDNRLLTIDELNESDLEYIKKRKQYASEKMHAFTSTNGCEYEFYKGQMLVLREILSPKYRIDRL